MVSGVTLYVCANADKCVTSPCLHCRPHTPMRNGRYPHHDCSRYSQLNCGRTETGKHLDGWCVVVVEVVEVDKDESVYAIRM